MSAGAGAEAERRCRARTWQHAQEATGGTATIHSPGHPAIARPKVGNLVKPTSSCFVSCSRNDSSACLAGEGGASKAPPAASAAARAAFACAAATAAETGAAADDDDDDDDDDEDKDDDPP